MSKKQKEVEIIEIENIDKSKYETDLCYANSGWREYWEQSLRKEYKDSELVKKIDTLQKIINCYRFIIIEVQEGNKCLLEENISLGEQIEELKKDLRLKDREIWDLKLIVGEKPKGIFDLTSTLIKQRKESKILKIENRELKQEKLQIVSQKTTQLEQNVNTLQPISIDTVEHILELKVKGMNYNEISKITKVSTATVSRYINKNKKRLRQIEQSNSNSVNV